MHKRNYAKIIVILFSTAVLLLISHLILSRIYSEYSAQSVFHLDDEEIINMFNQSLQSFGLKDEWIKKNKNDDIDYSYKVKVPNDLPISYIIFDLHYRYHPYGITVQAEEKKMNLQTLVLVLKENHPKLKIEFISDNNLIRTTSVTSLFIYGRDKNELEFDSLFRIINCNYSALLLPAKSAAIFAKWLTNNGFNYAVLLNNDIVDLDFRLAKEFPIKRIRLVVRNLVGAFPNALFFIVDKGSDFYSHPTYDSLIAEFDKRKIFLLSSDYIHFINSNQSDFNKTFINIIKQNEESTKNKIAIDYERFISLEEEINNLLRSGYKFEMLKREEIKSSEDFMR